MEILLPENTKIVLEISSKDFALLCHPLAKLAVLIN